jgi:hypothetical protein
VGREGAVALLPVHLMYKKGVDKGNLMKFGVNEGYNERICVSKFDLI